MYTKSIYVAIYVQELGTTQMADTIEVKSCIYKITATNVIVIQLTIIYVSQHYTILYYTIRAEHTEPLSTVSTLQIKHNAISRRLLTRLRYMEEQVSIVD